MEAHIFTFSNLNSLNTEIYYQDIYSAPTTHRRLKTFTKKTETHSTMNHQCDKFDVSLLESVCTWVSLSRDSRSLFLLCKTFINWSQTSFRNWINCIVCMHYYQLGVHPSNCEFFRDQLCHVLSIFYWEMGKKGIFSHINCFNDLYHYCHLLQSSKHAMETQKNIFSSVWMVFFPVGDSQI